MSRTHNELSQVVVIVRPLDAQGNPTLPTTAAYRIDDCLSGKVLVDWTTLAPSIDMTITIPGSVNAIVNNALQQPEVKTVTVRIDEDLATQHYGQYTYRVKNLGFAQVA